MAIGTSHRISTRITSLSFGLVVATVLTLMVILLVMKGQMTSSLARILETQGRAETGKLAETFYDTCAASEAQTRRTLSHCLGVAREQVRARGGISLGEEMVEWNVENPLTTKSEQLKLPQLKVGSNWLGQSLTFDEPCSLVDDTKRFTGAEVTIFQRVNELGDMVRVATTIHKPDGTRAVGTSLTVTDKDSTPNPVLAVVLQGRTFEGRALVVGEWHATVYEPLWDSRRKEVIGMLFAGVSMTETTRAVRESASQVVLGKTGYVFIMGAQGDQRARYFLWKNGTEDGIDVGGRTDGMGTPVTQRIIEKALATKPGEATLVDYAWKEPGQANARQKFAAVAYFEPWDWIIGVSAYADEYREAQQAGSAVIARMLWSILAASGLLALAALAVSYWIARSINRPLKSIANSLTTAAAQTTGAADHLSTTSRLLAEGATEQAASLEETSASLEELSSTTASNADHAKQVNTLSSLAATAVDRGLQDVQSLSDAMAGLRKSCDEIATVVRSIDEIAFQTNLLALDAAVEAARAGAAGQGFSVVAEEVRVLAQRSAGYSRETSVQIDAVLKSSAQSIEISGRVETTLADIAQHVSKVHQAATAVATSSEQQALGIRQINLSVSQVETVTQTSAARAEESAAGAEALQAQSARMRSSVEELLNLVEGPGTATAGISRISDSPCPGKRRKRSSTANTLSQPPRKALAT